MKNRFSSRFFKLLLILIVIAIPFNVDLAFVYYHINANLVKFSLYFTKYLPRIATAPHAPKFDTNQTHIWSFQFADEFYASLSQNIPCQKLQYYGGDDNDTLDSCDRSEDAEFSIKATSEAQKWIFEHQHPQNCSDKKFVIIKNFALSGFGSTLHQVFGAFSYALISNRIAVYAAPNDWLYGDCPHRNPDCFFLPISNCSAPENIDGNRTIELRTVATGWRIPSRPKVFRNKSFNWYRSQIFFYLLRFNNRTIEQVRNILIENRLKPELALYRPYASIFVRRSDKVTSGEMSKSFSLKDYFRILETDLSRLNISTIYLNSEDELIYAEFEKLNNALNGSYKLITLKTTKNVVFGKLLTMSKKQRARVVFEFLTDLYIEVHGDLQSGTLSSNWCRLVDEFKLVLGKTIPFYTPEGKYYINY